VKKSELYLLLGVAVFAYFAYSKSSPAAASSGAYQSLTTLPGNIGLYDAPIDVLSSLSSTATIQPVAMPSYPLLPLAGNNLILGNAGAY
jgi:hypothetical protein